MIDNKPFKIKLNSTKYYKKGTIIRSGSFSKVIVIRRYKTTWLRLLFRSLGYKTNINILKVRKYV